MKIPMLQEPTVSKEVGRPSGSFQTAGLKGRAIQKVGDAIQNVGAATAAYVGDLEKQRKRAEISEFSDNAIRKYKMAGNNFITDLGSNSFGSDHKGYSEEIHKSLDDSAKSLSDTAPSPEARDYFLKKVKPWMDSKKISSGSYEHLKRAEFYYIEREQVFDESAAQFFDNPNPFDAAADLASAQVELSQNKYFGKSYRSKLLKGYQIKLRQNVFDGMLRDGLPGFVHPSMTKEEKEASLDSFIGGKVVGTEELFQGISSTEARNMKIKAMALIEREENARNAETKFLVGNAVNTYTSETHITPREKGQINAASNRIDALPEGVEKDNIQKGLINAKKINELLKRSVFIPNGDLKKINVKNLIKDENLITAKTDKASQAMVQQAIDTTIKTRNADGAEWIQKHFPSKSNNISDSIAMQKELQIPSPRVQSIDESSAASQGILEGISAQDKALELDKFLASKGEFAPQAVSELIKDNKNFDEQYLIASYLDSTLAKTSVISNIGATKEINTEFKANFPGMDLSLKSEVQKEIKGVMKVFANSGIKTLGSSFRKAITTHAQLLMNKDEGLSTSEAATKAAQIILHDNFETMSNGRSHVIIPKSLGVSKVTVDAFMEDSFNPKAIKSFNISKPKAFTGTQAEFDETVSNNSFWATNESQDGLTMLATDPNTGITGRVRDAKGNFINMPYQAMRQDQRTLDNLNFGFLTPIKQHFLKQGK